MEGLKKLCVAVFFRSEKHSGKKEPEMLVRFYISSADLTAEKFANAMRSHWDVENKLHWRWMWRWTESTSRQSLRGAGFRNLAL